VYGLLTVSVPLWQDMNEELGFTYPQLNNSYGVSAASLSFGCVVFTPFALRYGRRPVYIVTSLLMFVTNIWVAEMKSLGDLYGSNLVLGMAGSVNEALYQMTVRPFTAQR
jgi:predicted MFS family arabinose efflux permease